MATRRRPLRPAVPPEDALRHNLVRWGLGFFGGLAAILIVPRLLKFSAKRFAFSFVAEVLAVVVAGLLTERAVDTLSRDD